MSTCYFTVGGEAKKNFISSFGEASRKKIAVLLSASVERFGVSHMQDFQRIGPLGRCGLVVAMSRYIYIYIYLYIYVYIYVPLSVFFCVWAYV